MRNEADADFEGVQESINDVKKQMLIEAEEHYRTGVKEFLNAELRKAIEEWEQTLALNPEHAKASQDIKHAQTLLDKLEKVPKVP